MSTHVDVVTVTRNDLSGLQRTARSVQAQQHPRLNWVVVDGASTDGTPEWLRREHGDDVDWTSEPDRGIYDAMNKGLARCTGEYVLFMNGGDSFATPDSLGALVAAADAAGSWAYGATDMHEEDDEGGALETHRFVPFSARRLTLGLNSVPMQSALLRTADCRALGGFDITSGLAADQQFFYRLSLRRRPVVVDEVTARRTVGGISWAQPAHAFPLDMRRYRLAEGRPVAASALLDGAVTAAVITRQALLRHVPLRRAA